MLGRAEDLAKRIQEVDLNSAFFERISGSVTTSADLGAAGVSSMVVKVRYGVRDDGTSPKDSKEFVLRAAGDKGEYSFFMDRRKSVNIEYQVEVNYKGDYAIGSPELVARTEWLSTSTRNLDIDPRSVGALIPVTVTAGTIDWSSLRSLQGKVVYDDPGNSVHGERSFLLTQNEPTINIPIRPKDSEKTDYSVEAVFAFDQAQLPVAETRKGGSPGGPEHAPGTGDPGLDRGFDPLGRYKRMAVELKHEGGGQEQRKLIELAGDAASESWTFFRANEQVEPEYSYQITRFCRLAPAATNGPRRARGSWWSETCSPACWRSRSTCSRPISRRSVSPRCGAPDVSGCRAGCGQRYREAVRRCSRALHLAACP